MIDGDARHAARRRAGRDDDLRVRLERLRVALEHLDDAVAGQSCGPLDPVDLVLLEEELDPLGQADDDLVLAGMHLLHVDRDRHSRTVTDRHAPLLRALHNLQRMRVLEQGLGRNAAPDEAGAAERLLLLDTGYFEPELGGADRGHIPTGAGSNHDDVVFVGHFFKEERGTNEVIAAGRGAAASASGSGSRRPAPVSRRLRRTFNCPISYRSSQYDSASRSARLPRLRERNRAAMASRTETPARTMEKVNKPSTLTNGLQQCQPAATMTALPHEVDEPEAQDRSHRR